MAKQSALPFNLPPRLILREAAAAYVSVSPAMFDELVKSGRMPKPRRITYRRVGWVVRELDAAVDLLPTVGGDTEDTSWDD
jgi:predicted DNA-binding transcriptional regulator AlpA